MRISLAPRRLFGRVAILIIGIAVAQFLVTILLYDRISRDSVREDHARRVAELLEVSERLVERDQADVAAIMTTRHLQVRVTGQPAITAVSSDDVGRQITALVKAWEPSLAAVPLHMAIEHRRGRDHLVGSMRLDDGQWLNFRSTNLSGAWPIIASATLISLALTGLCVLFAVLALRQLGAPLRHLTEATRHIGEGRKVTLEEEGTSDLRNLSRAFNAMQERIASIIADQTRSFVAISHDLRTPLSRLRLASETIDDAETRELAEASVGEMEAMIASLQSFLKVQDATDQAASTDLAQVVCEAGTRWRGLFDILDEAAVSPLLTYPNVLRLALEPLIENAVQYGGRAQVAFVGGDIVISDDGPGVDEAHFASLVEPFFRADAARARNTPGFGLGIPRAHRLLQRFGGALSFRRGQQGGLEVVVTPPRPRLAD